MFQDFRSKMITFIERIKEKINKQFHPEKIFLIDNSNLHQKHKAFNSNKFYLKLIIKSKKLRNMKQIEAHKAIFSVLKEELENKIHALEIKIE